MPPMTTYPSKPSDVWIWTDSKGETNVKPRLVLCLTCKYFTVTNLAGPRCSRCESYLVTPVASHELDRRRS